jgi:RNA polymerase sigma-70 factor (ECF subfamily)
LADDTDMQWDEERRSETMGERELVALARDGDRDAFGHLFRTHYPAIYRMARAGLGDGADDAAAETFLRAWTALPRYRDTGAPFAAWLAGIARHVIVDEFRRRTRSKPRDHVDPGSFEHHHEDRMALAAALEKLPDEQRQILELKFFLGLTNDEIAMALGKGAGAVNTQQWRALQALRKVMPP